MWQASQTVNGLKDFPSLHPCVVPQTASGAFLLLPASWCAILQGSSRVPLQPPPAALLSSVPLYVSSVCLCFKGTEAHFRALDAPAAAATSLTPGAQLSQGKGCFFHRPGSEMARPCSPLERRQLSKGARRPRGYWQSINHGWVGG